MNFSYSIYFVFLLLWFISCDTVEGMHYMRNSVQVEKDLSSIIWGLIDTKNESQQNNFVLQKNADSMPNEITKLVASKLTFGYIEKLRNYVSASNLFPLPDTIKFDTQVLKDLFSLLYKRPLKNLEEYKNIPGLSKDFLEDLSKLLIDAKHIEIDAKESEIFWIEYFDWFLMNQKSLNHVEKLKLSNVPSYVAQKILLKCHLKIHILSSLEIRRMNVDSILNDNYKAANNEVIQLLPSEQYRLKRLIISKVHNTNNDLWFYGLMEQVILLSKRLIMVEMDTMFFTIMHEKLQYHTDKNRQKIFLTALNNMIYLNSIILYHLYPNDEAIYQIHLLQNKPNLVELSLNDNSQRNQLNALLKTYPKEFLNILRNLNHLETLCLNHMFTSELLSIDSLYEFLVASLQHKKSLSVLNISTFPLGYLLASIPYYAIKTIESVLKSLTELKTLLIPGVFMSYHPQAELTTPEILLAFLHDKPKLEVLDLSFNPEIIVWDWRREYMREFNQLVKRLISLKELELNNNNLGNYGSGWSFLIQMMRGLKSVKLEKMMLLSNNLNQMREDVFKIFIHALSQFSNLHFLGLCENQLKESHREQLIEMLERKSIHNNNT